MHNEIHLHYIADGHDFTRAGEISSKVKKQLKQLGLSPEIIRRVAIAMYEAEINMVIHAHGGEVDVTITAEKIHMIFRDQGPGIADVDKAMQEGYSTAGQEVRELGFGAGMGLPNIAKNTDQFTIDTKVGVGTTMDLVIFVR